MGLVLFYLQLQKISNITEVIKNTANSYDPTQRACDARAEKKLGHEVTAQAPLGRVGHGRMPSMTPFCGSHVSGAEDGIPKASSYAKGGTFWLLGPILGDPRRRGRLFPRWGLSFQILCL